MPFSSNELVKTRRCVEWRRQRKEERGQSDENYFFIYLFR
jgi:hypothetical protein